MVKFCLKNFLIRKTVVFLKEKIMWFFLKNIFNFRKKKKAVKVELYRLMRMNRKLSYKGR
ncbi:hypothetical protein DDV96_12295 [Marixanthomonas spongiae]|uniref:Uncharacterized protein n=1 Tax=Marixanthomonas spongiae TaxID=2174845 RepID=A0A2U0HYH9_9FLAO|nr:hypothetical protein DDV96_12295 [Marixanthomonas spongiae]